MWLCGYPHAMMQAPDYSVAGMTDYDQWSTVTHTDRQETMVTNYIRLCQLYQIMLVTLDYAGYIILCWLYQIMLAILDFKVRSDYAGCIRLCWLYQIMLVTLEFAGYIRLYRLYQIMMVLSDYAGYIRFLGLQRESRNLDSFPQ